MSYQSGTRAGYAERLAIVVEQHAAGVSAKEIALIVGRSEATVRAIAWKLGLSFKTSSSRAKVRREIIRSNYETGVAVADIAKHLGMTAGSVKVIASQIGCTNKGSAIFDYRRGFSVPDHLHDDYDLLRRKGGMRAREAAKTLGLIGGAA